MKIDDPAHTPVRGDLAHVRLAGRYFVPHYAVPALHSVIAGGAQLLSSSRSDAEVLAALRKTGVEEIGTMPVNQIAEQMRLDAVKWGDVIRRAKVTMDS